jgi:hypothetical protein
MTQCQGGDGVDGGAVGPGLGRHRSNASERSTFHQGAIKLRLAAYFGVRMRRRWIVSTSSSLSIQTHMAMGRLSSVPGLGWRR